MLSLSYKACPIEARVPEGGKTKLLTVAIENCIEAILLVVLQRLPQNHARLRTGHEWLLTGATVGVLPLFSLPRKGHSGE